MTPNEKAQLFKHELLELCKKYNVTTYTTYEGSDIFVVDGIEIWCDLSELVK